MRGRGERQKGNIREIRESDNLEREIENKEESWKEGGTILSKPRECEKAGANREPYRISDDLLRQRTIAQLKRGGPQID